MIYVGADPGRHGGLAALDGRTDKVLLFKPLPADYEALLGLVQSLDRLGAGCVVCCLEKVGGYIGTPQPGSYMFSFGEEYGRLRMALVACGYEPGRTLYEPTPQEWQGGLGIRPRLKKGTAAETTEQFKQRLKRLASRWFPEILVSYDVADALLIAMYCRQIFYEKAQGATNVPTQQCS